MLWKFCAFKQLSLVSDKAMRGFESDDRVIPNGDFRGNPNNITKTHDFFEIKSVGKSDLQNFCEICGTYILKGRRFICRGIFGNFFLQFSILVKS